MNRKCLVPLLVLIFSLVALSTVYADVGEKFNVSDKNHFFVVYSINNDLYVRAEDMAYALDNTSLRFDVKKDNNTLFFDVGKNYSGNFKRFSGKTQYKTLESKQIGGDLGGYPIVLQSYTIEGNDFVKLSDIGKITGFSYTRKLSSGELTVTKQFNTLPGWEETKDTTVLTADYLSMITEYCFSRIISNNVKAVTRTARIGMELMPENYSLKSGSPVFDDILPKPITFHMDEPSHDVDPDKPMVAVTFDDGPKGENTEKILTALDKVGGKATFFMVGTNVDRYPDTVKHVYQQGSEVANHSYSHPQLTKLSLSQAMEQINKVQQSVYKITGRYPKSGRPPYGSINSDINKASGLNWYNWSIDTLDWKYKDPQRVYNAVVDTVEDGDIILMHDIHETTVEAALMIIPKLHEMGYQLVTVSELAEAKGKENISGYIDP